MIKKKFPSFINPSHFYRHNQTNAFRCTVETFQMFKGTVCVMDEGEKKPF